MALGDDRDLRNFLKACVACWLANNQQPIDGANDPREFVESEWVDAAEMTEDLIESGRLANASGDLARNGEPADLKVWPTALGIFEAIS